MEHQLAAGNRPAQRFRIAQIAGHPLSRYAFQIGGGTGRANQQAKVGALISQQTRYMAAEKPRGSCDQRLHGERRYSSSSGCSEIFFSPATFFSQYWRTQFSQPLPAAISRPVHARAAISPYAMALFAPPLLGSSRTKESSRLRPLRRSKT